jgi:hypothetical protein
MKDKKGWFAATALVISLGLVGCGEVASAGSAPEGPAAAQLSEPDQNGVKAVTLSAQAAQRLGIASAPIRGVAYRSSHATQSKLIMPYAALVYDEDGKTWAYVITHPLTYVRQPVSVDHIDADEAYLAAGPATGTAVVTTGSEELLGAELEISGE